MRRAIAALLILTVAPSALAQHRLRPLPENPNVLKPGPVQRPESSETVPPETFSAKNLPYINPPHETQELDIWAPMTTTYPGQKETVVPPRPLIVWIHGGGWIGGNKDHCPAVALVKDGFVVASINYRLSSEAKFPAQIEDCKAAIRWLRAHAKNYNIDVNHVGVWGASAGGHLAALLGTSGDVKDLEGGGDNLDQSSRVQAVCDWYGPTDLLQFTRQAIDAKLPNAQHAGDAESLLGRLFGGAPAQKADLAKSANPITYITKDDPPFLIMHGDQDQVVPLAQSQLLLDALKAASIDVSFEVVKGRGHGDLNVNGLDAFQQVREFFIKNLKPADGTAVSPNPPASK
jgi:acetyl esterase/lipase